MLLIATCHTTLAGFHGQCCNTHGWVAADQRQYCEHGSLLSLLRERRGFNALSFMSQLLLARDTVAGMTYLTGCGFVHRDLAGVSARSDSHPIYRHRHRLDLPRSAVLNACRLFLPFQHATF